MRLSGLTFLFTGICLALLVVAGAAFAGAHGPARWVIGFAAVALAGWMASLAASASRRH